MNTINCPKCSSTIEDTYSFCPKCGTLLKKEQSSKSAETINPEPISIPSSVSKEKYSSGIKTTFIWSTALSLINILLAAFKGLADANLVAENLIQGVFVRPLIVLLLAYIISAFSKSKEKQISKFNAVTTYILAILSVGELFRWFIRGGS